MFSDTSEIIELIKIFEQKTKKFALVLQLPDDSIKCYSSTEITLSNLLQLRETFVDPTKSSIETSPNSIPTFKPQDVPVTESPSIIAIKDHTIQITTSSNGDILNHLRSCFRELQQLLCKSIAKNWIKVIEPKKQSNHPYKQGDSCKPNWWPQTVKHVEPDHLTKKERIALLVSIIMNPSFDLMKIKDSSKMLIRDHYKEKVFDELFYVVELVRKYHIDGIDRVITVSDFDNADRGTKRKQDKVYNTDVHGLSTPKQDYSIERGTFVQDYQSRELIQALHQSNELDNLMINQGFHERVFDMEEHSTFNHLNSFKFETN